MNHQDPEVGTPILYFPGGATLPQAGFVAGLVDSGRVNLSCTNFNGQPIAYQGVPFVTEPDASGAFAIHNDGDVGAVLERYRTAMAKAQFGQPDPSQAPDKGKGKLAGDASATLSSTNKQKPGSGGTFDPANTALAHMTEHQREETLSPGNPTTGGVTPKLSTKTMANLSERDREAAEAIHNAKTDKEKAKLADSGTGVATRGTADAIVKDRRERTKMATQGKAPPQAPVRPAVANTGVNVEQDRTAREKQANKEAIERSEEIKKQRAAETRGATPPAAKAPAKKVPAKKAPAKKAAAKKAPAKAVKKAAKKRR